MHCALRNFMHCLCVVVILFSNVYISPYFLPFFETLDFCLSEFWLFMFLCIWFLVFIFFFHVLNSMSFLIISGLITFFNFVLDLFRSLFTNFDDFSQIHECLFAEHFKKPSKILFMLPFQIYVDVFNTCGKHWYIIPLMQKNDPIFSSTF